MWGIVATTRGTIKSLCLTAEGAERDREVNGLNHARIAFCLPNRVYSQSVHGVLGDRQT